MADHTQTITNNLGMVGLSEVNLWGTMLWNENWGTSGEAWTGAGKWLSESIVVEDFITKEIFITLTNSFSLTSLLRDVKMGDGIWLDVFTRSTTDGLQQVYTDWTGV